ncbi:MAG: hypothetical protein LBK13_03640, partial [Spirochaetales bacterium]|nr:hypothetical protein [Spirochaetales bacterium]
QLCAYPALPFADSFNFAVKILIFYRHDGWSNRFYIRPLWLVFKTHLKNSFSCVLINFYI